ncbi:trypsin-4-like [Zootermopsis nevadensis]|uniref:trypsin-4-like n=1 Tax=Zootermopsis nevadensis TaxID=136037 RepID=UPI000B8E6D72|nr:trypsin-4-like [Zootermopsis nevadensis]
MLRLLTLFSVIVLVGVKGSPGNVDTINGGRIVNGTDATPGQFPFQISLQYDYEHVCGGTILSSKWILTAAHCVEDEVAIYYSVLAGTNVLSKGGERRHVLRYKIHPNYDPENYENDIAVLELESHLSMTGYVAVVTLPSQTQITDGGLPSTVIGWGHRFTGGPTSDTLKMVKIVTISDEECYEILTGYVKPSNICAGVPGGGKGHCSGDSGGPLIANNYQVGIVSWSVKPCTQPPYPGVYTEVAYYVDWIKTVTNV